MFWRPRLLDTLTTPYSAKDALASAASAAQAAADASTSLAQTIEYDQQATKDADAADTAATTAEGYAQDARASADQAELDASAARQAAADAEQAATNARAAADQAAEDAAAAEKAAADAQAAAESAQQAAELAGKEEANKAVVTGTVTGAERTFYVVDKIAEAGPAKQLNDCVYTLQGCTVTYELHLDITVSYYYCLNLDVPATESGCPKQDTLYLGTEKLKDQTNNWTHHFTFEEITKLGWQSLFGDKVGAVLYELVLGDAFRCYHGDKSSCAWAATILVPESVATKLANAVKLADGLRRLSRPERTRLRYSRN